MGKESLLFLTKKAQRVNEKEKRRAKQLKKRRKGNQKRRQNFNGSHPIKRKFIGNNYALLRMKPEYGAIVKFLIPRYKKFSLQHIPINEDGHLLVPPTFSISEETEDAMFFLKRLFHCLYTQNHKIIKIDYQNCNYVDVDASACMDLILQGFINYYNKCENKGHKVKIDKIIPINFQHKKHITDFLFSIGAYRNIKNLIKAPPSDVIPFDLKIGDRKHDKEGVKKEIHETQIVDYVIDCLKSTGYLLNPEAETNLSKVVGEVMANAEEHSNFRYRFAIGYFVKPNINNELGIFKLCIFNFGDTIYETFSKPEKSDFPIVKKMRELSGKFTKSNMFKKAKYEEETLWTLYSLQEGVTSVKNWKRGKGTIRFIDRFFRLKSDTQNDEISRLTLLSGNTKIIFDGSYPLKEVSSDNDSAPMQVMTFNDSGDISQAPNEKFVTFVPQNFPGTMITAKICLTDKNTY